MFFKLFLLFTVVPVTELWLLILVGERIGGLQTVALVVVTGALGAWFARAQGAEVMRALQTATAQGRMPTDEVIDGALILAGGALLITPGVITDFVGLSLVAPFTRRPLRGWLKRTMAGRMTVVTYGAPPFTRSRPGGQPTPPPANDKDVIDV